MCFFFQNRYTFYWVFGKYNKNQPFSYFPNLCTRNSSFSAFMIFQSFPSLTTNNEIFSAKKARFAELALRFGSFIFCECQKRRQTERMLTPGIFRAGRFSSANNLLSSALLSAIAYLAVLCNFGKPERSFGLMIHDVSKKHEIICVHWYWARINLCNKLV